MKRFVRTMFFVLLLIFPALGNSQSERPKNTYTATISDTAAKYAPEIRSDHTVILSLLAPESRRVELSLGDLDPPRPMIKGNDGVWRITVGPLEPDVYGYFFLVDGVAAIDMSNPQVGHGRARHRSYFEIPGTPPRFDERQDVPHGTLHIREYESAVVKMRRRVLIYVPSEYDSQPNKKFPVLYLRHGNGSLEDTWQEAGRAGDILDNLLARRRAIPMLIVMPNGYPSLTGEGNSEEGITVTGEELLQEIIPLVEKSYRVLPTRENRAIAGYSMGATQAIFSGLRHLDTFAWVAGFSSGAVADKDFKLDQIVPGFLENQATRKQLRLLFLSCGTEDPRYPGHLDLVDTLKKREVPHQWFSTSGGHEYKVWRHSLAELLPRLFQPASGTP